VLPTWKTNLDTPGAFQMKILKDIITAQSWWELVPDQSIFASQAVEGTTLNTAARSESGNWVMAYLSSPTTVSIRMDKITTSDRVDAFWIDPRSGAQTIIGNYPNSGTPSFSTPASWEDALLLLKG
jgi:hypothetical protein